jgi:hypothetical protein
MRHIESSLRRAIVPVLLAIVAADVTAGGMWVSNRDRALAINAWGGAQNGAVLRLHNGCRPNNPDCTWTYSRGMLISDMNPGLAIGVDHPPKAGADVKLLPVQNCRPELANCLWTYRDGMFTSGANPSFAINAWGGARYGTVLKLNSACRPDNPDCTWSRQ